MASLGFLVRSIACGVSAACLLLSAEAPAQTLQAVKQRGSLICGVSQGVLGFSSRSDKGEWSGLDVLRKAQQQGVSTPMILLTGERDPDLDQAATSFGAVDFLKKAKMSPEELERSIRFAASNGRIVATRTSHPSVTSYEIGCRDERSTSRSAHHGPTGAARRPVRIASNASVPTAGSDMSKR